MWSAQTANRAVFVVNSQQCSRVVQGAILVHCVETRLPGVVVEGIQSLAPKQTGDGRCHHDDEIRVLHPSGIHINRHHMRRQ